MKKITSILLIICLITLSVPSLVNAGSADRGVTRYEVEYKDLSLIDKINFVFTVSNELKGDIFGEIADIDTEIKMCLEHYVAANNTEYYILRMEGNKRQIALWAVGALKRDNKSAKPSAGNLTFFEQTQLSDDYLLMYMYDDDIGKHEINLGIEFENDILQKFTLKYKKYKPSQNVEYIEYTNLITDLEHECLEPENITMADWFGEMEKVYKIRSVVKSTISPKEETPEPIEPYIKEVHSRNIYKYALIDRFYFTFIANEDFDGVITTEVAELGTEVSAIVEHYNTGAVNVNYYILTLKGNIGEIKLWEQKISPMDKNSILSSGSPLLITANHRVEGNSLVVYAGIKGGFYVNGNFKNNTLEDVLIIFEKGNILSSLLSHYESEGAHGKNIVYESFVSGNTDMTDMFTEKDKQEEIEKALEEGKIYDVPEQDPERTVTQIKGVSNDGSVWDYKITFMAEIPLDLTNSKTLPDWYRELGSDVKATMVGFSQYLNGERRREYTMIRFTGSKGNLWFNNQGINATKDRVDISYVSLISFDGIERIYNSVTHESMNASLTFTDDGTQEVSGITMNIGNKTVSVDKDNIKYIGGGIATHGMLW